MSHHTIAVVDDDPAMRVALTRLLRSLDYDPLLFDSAEDLLAAFDAVRPECIVTDVQMPGINGLDLLRLLRLRRPDLPVILITAYPSSSSRDRALASGARAYLPKPFDADEFERCLATIFAPD
ncbi:response regulator [Mangrovicella endophytica]|uniref:response regulator n=1 Tax=Mangrovicella endophytica TaxID=2066697 RepID=UPI000C9EA37E|nr:response regulator [Mangrovicella endophytica]